MTKLKTLFLILIVSVGFVRADSNWPWYIPFDISIGYGCVHHGGDDNHQQGDTYTLSADFIPFGRAHILGLFPEEKPYEPTYIPSHTFLWSIQTRLSYNSDETNFDFLVQPNLQYLFIMGILGASIGPSVGFIGTEFVYGFSAKLTGFFFFQVEYGYLFRIEGEIISFHLNIPFGLGGV